MSGLKLAVFAICTKWCTHVFVTGYEAVTDELKSMNEEQMVNLVKDWESDRNDGLCEITCCPSVGVLREIVTPFVIMQESEQFLHHWKEIWLGLVKEADGAQVDHLSVVEYVWKPTLQWCCDLLDRIHRGAIKLRELSQIFNLRNPDQIKVEVTTLVKALLKSGYVLPEEVSRLDWIDPFVDQVKHYRSAFNCQKAAQAVLRFMNRLKLPAEFPLIWGTAIKVS